MKHIKYTIIALIATMTMSGCDFLDVEPQGLLTEDEAMSAKNVDGLVTSAYSSLGNDHYDRPFSLWFFGNVRAGDAYKGGNDESDGADMHFYEIAENIKTTFYEGDGFWVACYSGISRANNALKALDQISETDLPTKNARMGEAYFLRAHFYFQLKIVFSHIPFIDENTPITDYDKISNTLSNDEQWAIIVSDFQKAYDLLPDNQAQVGRANKVAAAAYLAKANLYKAYRQDDKNNVINIDAADLEQVLKYTEYAMKSNYELEYDFGYNFLPGTYENGSEALFSVQYSKDDGTMFGRLNFGDVLSVPMGLGCCDFHKPSQNLVNAYKTQNGLPMFTNFDDWNYDPQNSKSDPRLFHTVAMPELPYKYNKSLIYKEKWNRNVPVYGIYASLKENVDPSCDCFVNMSPFYGNTKNRIVIRFADVILMRAEALIELHRQNESLILINQIRERAKRSITLIDYAPNLDVALYENGVNCTWTETYAREALRWERRLEFAMEGSRFFDLVRWGIAEQYMNKYYTTESARRSYLKAARFTKNKNEYVPIPQQQISFSKGLYKQNYGW